VEPIEKEKGFEETVTKEKTTEVKDLATDEPVMKEKVVEKKITKKEKKR